MLIYEGYQEKAIDLLDAIKSEYYADFWKGLMELAAQTDKSMYSFFYNNLKNVAVYHSDLHVEEARKLEFSADYITSTFREKDQRSIWRKTLATIALKMGEPTWNEIEDYVARFLLNMQVDLRLSGKNVDSIPALEEYNLS